MSICLHLSLTDLFVAGIGVELVGAWLIARGLLLSLPLLKAFGAQAGIGAADVVDRARNRVDGQFGVGLLVVGFLLQMVGYVLEVGGDHIDKGGGQVPGALAVLAVAIGVAWLPWLAGHSRAFKGTLVRTAFAPMRSAEGDIAEGREANIATLARYGKAAGWQALMYESDESYVVRVFGEVG